MVDIRLRVAVGSGFVDHDTILLYYQVVDVLVGVYVDEVPYVVVEVHGYQFWENRIFQH